MLEPSGAEIDPNLFQRDNRHLPLLLCMTAHQLEETSRVVQAFEGFDPVAMARGELREIEEEGGELAESVERLGDMLGEDFMADFVADIPGVVESPVTDEEYEKARALRDEVSTTLIDHVVGFHDYIFKNLAAAYGEGGEQVDEEAWLATWRKLKDVLGNSEGTLLAEAASFFDQIVRDKFGEKYRPMETDRGAEVSADVCARTFYIVMQDHLPRAIVGANRDEWTGYQ